MANENEKPIHNIAIASLACAILGIFLFGIIAGAAAIGLGFYAKSQIEKGNGRGLKMALSGIWAGVVVLALSLLGMLIEEPEVVGVDEDDFKYANSSLLNMIKVAEELDTKGRYKEAEEIHNILKKHILL